MADETKAGAVAVRNFFEEGGRKLPISEIKAMKEEDPEGYDQIAVGIGNGSLTY